MSMDSKVNSTAERVSDVDSNKGESSFAGNAEADSKELGDTVRTPICAELEDHFSTYTHPKRFHFEEVSFVSELNGVREMVARELNPMLEKNTSISESHAMSKKQHQEFGYQEIEPSDSACLTMSLGTYCTKPPDNKDASVVGSSSAGYIHPFDSNGDDIDAKTMALFDSTRDRHRQLLPMKQGPPKSFQDGSRESSQHIPVRVARPPLEGRGRNQLLPRYWPRITDQELQQITAGDSNSTITPLFEKMLSASDAGRIGRLVLPKACAEAYFPAISQPEGLPLKIQDITGKDWIFQFRFWPNNNSRMYVLEGVTPCIQSMQLQAGDTVTFSRLDPEGKLVMGYRRAPSSLSSQENQLPSYCGSSCAPPTVAIGGVDNLSSMASLSGLLSQSVKNASDVHAAGNPTQYHSLETGYGWHKIEKVGPRSKDSFFSPSAVAGEKKRSRQMSSKSKRLRMETEEAAEFRITWDEAQDLLRSPPNVVPSIVTIEGYDFEEYEEPPVFGKRTLFTSRNWGSSEDQWAQCDECGKWRRVPAELFLPTRWSCSDNVWDVERNSCNAAQEVSSEEIELLLQHLKVCSPDDKSREGGDPSKVTEPISGLEALANAATTGEEKNDAPSSPSPAATTKHPRHRPGCTCIVCIQPPSGKGPKHKPTCNCNVCMTVKRRFKTLMMRRKKRQSEREAENAARKKKPWIKEDGDGGIWQNGGYPLPAENVTTQQGSLMMTFPGILPRTSDFSLHGARFASTVPFTAGSYASSSTNPYGEQFVTSKSQIDLNTQPEREDDTNRGAMRISMVRLLQKASYPLDIYLKMHGLTSLLCPQQMLITPMNFHRNAFDRKSDDNNENHLPLMMDPDRVRDDLYMA